MNTENWIAVAAGFVAVVAAWISFAQARHAKTQTQATIEQAAIARQQLEQGEKAHREQNEPYVIVDIQPDGPGSALLVLLIENIGPTVARNVKVTSDPPLVSGVSEKQTERLQRALTRTIPMLPPGRRLKYVFDTNRRFDSGLPTAYTFTVQAVGPFGDVEPMEYLVDITSWTESLLGERPQAKVEKALGEVAAGLGAFVKAYQTANATSIRNEREEGYQRLRRELEGDEDSAS